MDRLSIQKVEITKFKHISICYEFSSSPFIVDNLENKWTLFRFYCVSGTIFCEI